MRDIDFLLAARAGDPLPSDRALVYRYRSGALRPRMIAALREIAAGRGLTLQLDKPPLMAGFDQANFFFPQLLLFDWPARTSSKFAIGELGRSLAFLAARPDGPSVHFLDVAGEIARDPMWEAVARVALVIEEPAITRESLPSVLRYLAATTDLAPGAHLLGQHRFFASFTGLIDERAKLPAVIQAFEERVLLCTDPATNLYDDTRYRRDLIGRLGRRLLLPHLRDLVALRRERDLVDLLCGFDERRAERGWSVHELVTVVYRITGRLLEPVSDQRRSRSEARSRVAPHRVAKGAVLWAALLLAWEDALINSVREDEAGYRRGPDLIVPALAGLGRDFLAREDRAEAGDPLEGRWPSVAHTLGRCGTDVRDDWGDPLEGVRGGFLRGLAAALARDHDEKPDWFRDLQEGVSAACDRFDAKVLRDEKRREEQQRKREEAQGREQAGEEEEEEQDEVRSLIPPPSPLHLNFASVIGRGQAVAGLGRHARERTDGVDLLLHGPDGVGKRILAWSYARMVLCDQPSDEGAACGRCESCRDFETGDSSCIEVDGKLSDIARLTEQIVKRIQKRRKYKGQFVFVIRNADYYPPEVFDKLLKPMEDSSHSSFVLLARDRHRVRVAGQSRCFDYRVRTLNWKEAERFLREVLVERGQSCDEAVLGSMIDAGEGLPERLLQNCEIVAKARSASLAAIRTELGMGWAEGLATRWPEIIARGPAVLPELLLLSGTDRAEQVRRVRAVLRWVHAEGMVGSSNGEDVMDPALRYLDEQTRAGFAAAIARQAAHEGTTVGVVWTRLIDTWMADRLSSEWCNVLRTVASDTK
jgi:DNA polymerase III delta prime subunit